MKIYLDIVFLLNFIIDFLILYGVKIVLKEKGRLIRIFLGSLTGSLTLILLFIDINSTILVIFKFIVSILIILVSFGKRNFCKNLAYFYLISIILGGSFYLLDITYEDGNLLVFKNNYLINFVVLILGSIFIIFLFIKEHIKYKEKYSNKYVVKIYLNKKMYELEGFIDTGNRLVDPYKRRCVILVNMKLRKQANYIYVPYKALNVTGVIPCLKPDKVIIEDKEFNNCLIGFSKDKINVDGASCILPNKFKEELWEK